MPSQDSRKAAGESEFAGAEGLAGHRRRMGESAWATVPEFGLRACFDPLILLKLNRAADQFVNQSLILFECEQNGTAGRCCEAA